MRLRLEALRRTSDSDAVALHSAWVDRDAGACASWCNSCSAKGARRSIAPAHRPALVRRRRRTSWHTQACCWHSHFPSCGAAETGGEPLSPCDPGAGAAVVRGDALANAEWLAIAGVGRGRRYRVARAAALSREEVLEDFGDQVVTRPLVEWHEATQSGRGRRRSTLGALVLAESALAEIDPALAPGVHAGHTSGGRQALPWWRAFAPGRAAFVHACLGGNDATWPDVSSDALGHRSTWLTPHLEDCALGDLAALDWSALMLGLLSGGNARSAPRRISKCQADRDRLGYRDPASPLAVKLQEVFGWTATPCCVTDACRSRCNCLQHNARCR
jgi:hypothetical protein